MKHYLIIVPFLLLFLACSEERDVVEEEKIYFYQVNAQVVNQQLDSLSLEQKIRQLLFVEYHDTLPKLSYGGFYSPTNSIDTLLALRSQADSLPVFPFLSFSNPMLLVNTENQKKLGLHYLFSANDSLLQQFIDWQNELKRQLGQNFDLQEVPFSDTSYSLFEQDTKELQARLASQFRSSHADTLIGAYGPYYLSANDTTPLFGQQQVWNTIIDSSRTEGLKGLVLSSASLNGNDGRDYFRTALKRQADFQGLIVLSDTASLWKQFQWGADMLLISRNRIAEMESFVQTLVQKVNNHSLDETAIDNRVRKILTAKLWMRSSKQYTSRKALEQDWIIPMREIRKRLIRSSLVLLHNKGKLPITDLMSAKPVLVSYGSSRFPQLYKNAVHYQNIKTKRIVKGSLGAWNPKRFNTIFLALSEQLDSVSGIEIQQFMDQFNARVTILNFGFPANLKWLDKAHQLVQVLEHIPESEREVGQALYGGVALNGVLAETAGTFERKVSKTTKKIRLAYTIPEEGGIHSDSLNKLRVIANQMVRSKASPGCQVLAIRDGKVIYEKAFGFHTYRKILPIDLDDVYDLASVTKITATTPAMMKMIDNKVFNLDDSLYRHLPDSLKKIMKRPSNFANITFREILLHKSGAPAGLNLIHYINYRDDSTGRWDKYFCDRSGNGFDTRLASGFWLDSDHVDSLWFKLNYTWLDPSKPYKYSDVNMNMLYMMIKSKLKKKETFSTFLRSNFYAPLGLRTLGYHPRKNLDTLKHQIVPTEYDAYWRGEVLKGFVHDPTAALFGGEAGSAGLFGNANDLGVFYQMLKNGGIYGGKRYLSPQVIRQFTSHQPGSHRGLGFNKPTTSSASYRADDCPPSAWGHTGFTGICVWVDEKNDLIFIFLSNRVYPDPMNKKLNQMGIRKHMHQVFYDQILPKPDTIQIVDSAKIEVQPDSAL